MTVFEVVDGIAAAMPAANIDTDVIMPKVFLKGIDRSGLAAGLFHDLRFDDQGRPRPDFVLNRPDHAGARFLLVGPNFGCGSSREHAVWGLRQFGIRALIGTSFAGIFADNAANNGLLLVSLAPDRLMPLMAAAEAGPLSLEIDLTDQHIRYPGGDLHFEVDERLRHSLMSGLDRIGETLTHAERIRAFERDYLGERPWLAER
ncbi:MULTISPECIES: 3-isopropylmalate dehydratase small subunit [Sphingomonas]|uniref:3-isopropylmalate dehydratase small subunit n=1 Tax=Sphingomonas TaxID=13687 RepID=UPI00092B6B15|nr:MULTISPECIES: 3-isopropylmalate dehydratase small subunit [Sphingomonas]MCW6529016.1 3-isopropylmalate dehydratase small subunit [Sphingomonas lycopersici]OJU17239.1 MAG: 3-isopropylmalate dehydratase small subunit [Sphingomonas sp. 66-10]